MRPSRVEEETGDGALEEKNGVLEPCAGDLISLRKNKADYGARMAHRHRSRRQLDPFGRSADRRQTPAGLGRVRTETAHDAVQRTGCRRPPCASRNVRAHSTYVLVPHGRPRLAVRFGIVARRLHCRRLCRSRELAPRPRLVLLVSGSTSL